MKLLASVRAARRAKGTAGHAKLCAKQHGPLRKPKRLTCKRSSGRLAAIRGNKRAIIAVASTILTIGYHLLQRGTTYQELGGDYFDKRNVLRSTRRLVKRLEALGHTVILQPACSALQARH
ncbi:MAG TPA: hypothetical protein VGV15_01900 [Terriglobales bacterium]|nr:hypothetical protein [Terriglobales bacterium]